MSSNFLIRYNQVFRPLRTSISNIHITLSLYPHKPRHLNHSGYICIIPIHLYRLDMPYDSRYTLAEISIYPIKSGSNLRTSCQAWVPLVYQSEDLCYCYQWSNEQSQYLYKGEVSVMSSKAFIYIATKENSRVVYPMTQEVSDL